MRTDREDDVQDIGGWERQEQQHPLYDILHIEGDMRYDVRGCKKDVCREYSERVIDMAQIPSNLIKNLVDRAEHDVGVSKDSKSYSMLKDTKGMYHLHHYGVEILRVHDREWEVGKRAYSASDRDAMNGVLRILNISGGVCVRDRKMMSIYGDELKIFDEGDD